MSILKQVIRYDNGPWLEATWVEREVLPDYEVPATPALFDADGVELQAAVEAYVVSGEIAETVVRCHAYHATQMDELRADLGADAAQYEGLIQQCLADYVPPPAIPIEQLRAIVWEQIKAERDRRAALGVKVGSHWYHSDQKSRTQQLGLVLLGANIPAGLQWKTLTFTPPPVFVTMTPALAQAIVGATAASDTAIFTAAEVHRLALEASATPQDYDFFVGWPTSIEEEANAEGIQFDSRLL